MTTTILMALRYLAGRKLRTALTTLAVVFGVAVLLAGNMMIPAAMESFRRMTLSASDAVDLSITTRSGDSFVPAGPAATVAGVRGVRAVSPVLRRQVQLINAPAGGFAQYDLVGVDPARAEAARPHQLAAGRFLQPGEGGVAVIGAPATQAGRISVGSSLPVVTAAGLKQFQIVGVLEARGELDPVQIIVTLPDAQAALAQPGLVNALEIGLVPGADHKTVRAAVLAALGPDYQAGDVSAQLGVGTALQAGYAVFNLLGLLALFVAGFLIFNTFQTVILERRHDLSMLRALGAERRQVTHMILIESLLQGAVGSALGLVLGYALSVGAAVGMSGLVDSLAPGMRMAVRLTPGPLLLSAALGMLATLLAGYLPARAAGRVSPLEGLRPTPPSDVRRAARWRLIAGGTVALLAVALLAAGPRAAAGGALLFLLGVALASSALVEPMARLLRPLLTLWFANEGDIAQGNMVRQPGRAAVTASTLMVGLAMIVVAGAMVSSLNDYLTGMIRRNFASDLVVMPQSLVLATNLGADESLAGQLRGLPQVQTVSSLRFATALVNDQPASAVGIDPAQFPWVSQLVYTEGDAEKALADLGAGRAVIANSLMASSLGLGAGDSMIVQTQAGPQTYRVAAVANDLLNLKMATFFISQANLKADLGRSDDVLIMIALKPGADPEAARQAAQGIVAGYPQFTLQVTATYRESLVQQFSQMMNLFYLLAALILIPASLGLLNTLAINVLERTREIGTVRAVGASRAQVRRMITAEALLLGLFGAGIGVLAGIAMSYGFIAAFATLGWRMPYAFSLVGVVAAVVVAILVALVASILPARNAARLDIIRALQYE